MRNLLLVLTGFLVGGAVVVAAAVAVPQNTTVTINQPPARSAMPMARATGSATMTWSAATPATRKLTIQHVQRGCHVFSNGTATGASMRLRLAFGQRLAVLNQDVDAHQLVQFAGPAKLRLGAPIMMNHSFTVSFARKGVYRLGTKVVEMPGMDMDVKTIGPDNNLRLVVTVA